MTVTTRPMARWNGAAICSWSARDSTGRIESVRAADVGRLEGAAVWSVLRLEFPDGGAVLAIGQSAAGASPYDPTGEYGSNIPVGMVRQSADRSSGSLEFFLPLARGSPFPLDGAAESLSGTFAWTCGAT